MAGDGGRFASSLFHSHASDGRPRWHVPRSMEPSCWVQHMSLDNETGLDPFGIKVRRVSGIVAADYFAPGYFVWAVLIANFARVGYEEKNMYMAAYDWLLSFQNTEVRDRTLSRLKRNIEIMVEINGGEKTVIIPHSMGVLYFLYFMKWVEAPAPMGGGSGPEWCAKHIKAVMNIGRPLFGAPKALAGRFSAEAKDIAFARCVRLNAPDMEIYSMYGVGIPTERAYVYKLTPQTEYYIPFQIDNTAGDTNSHVCLKDGVYTIDGDEIVPALSAGFMCAKGWRGKTRFNPSGIKTYVREYDHNPPSNLLEGQGTESGTHVDIFGNFQLLEDVLMLCSRVIKGVKRKEKKGKEKIVNFFLLCTLCSRV
ncbi:phospholipid:diacylglycerol acyltransferase [Tanacetum coccineum]